MPLSIQRLFRSIFRSRRAASLGEARGAWYRLSQTVMRFPVPVAVAVLGVLVLLGLPFLHASFTTPDVHVLPAGQEARVASDRLAQDFAQQGASTLVIVIRTPGNALSSDNLASLESYVAEDRSHARGGPGAKPGDRRPLALPGAVSAALR